MRVALLLLSTLLASTAVAAAPPDEPLRPEAKALPPVVAVQDRVPVSQPLPQSPEDCDAVPANSGAPKPYKELNLDEGEAQASAGLKILIESEKNIPPEDVAAKIEAAVGKFFAALAADPYNVTATYNLAASYARIGRNQCSLNLIARLVAMKDFHSRKQAVETRKFRLFGSGGKWKNKPDPDFKALRGRPEFEQVVKGF